MVLTTEKRLASLALVLAAGLVSAPAAAGPGAPSNTPSADRKAEGKALADRGYEQFQQGDYAAAIELFTQAEAISHSPMLLNFLAESHERLGRLIEARTFYKRLADEKLPALAPPAARRAQADARTKVSLLSQRIPRVQFELTGVPIETVEVKLDDRTLAATELTEPQQMNPGKHVLNVTAPDREPVMRTFEARERQLTTFAMHFAPVPPAPDAEEKITVVHEEGPSLVHVIGPAAAYGVGVTGLTMGLVSGLMYLGRADALKERCPNDRCIVELEGERETLTELGTLATVSLIIGGVGVTTGTLWWLLAPDSGNGADEAHARYLPELKVGAGSLQLTGTF